MSEATATEETGEGTPLDEELGADASRESQRVGTDDVDREAARRALRERAEDVRTHELATALSKLEARGDLTGAQRETVEALSVALVDDLLAAPERAIDRGDAALVERIRDLFGE